MDERQDIRKSYSKKKKDQRKRLLYAPYKRERHVVLKEAMTTAAELAGQRSRERGET